MMTRLRGGYRPSTYDGRDVNWSNEDNTDYVRSVWLTDPSSASPTVKDQGNDLDCCVSMAIATAMEIIDRQIGQGEELSALFNYYYARNNPRYVGPITIRSGLKAAAKKGLCRRGLHYVEMSAEGAKVKPSEVAIDDAKMQKIRAYNPATQSAGYRRLDWSDRFVTWRNALVAGYPIIAGIWAQSSYWSGEGMLVEQNENNAGAHAVCVVGFDDDEGIFIVRDSRGEGFGNLGNGEWSMSYDVARSPLVAESWSIKEITYDN